MFKKIISIIGVAAILIGAAVYFGLNSSGQFTLPFFSGNTVGCDGESLINPDRVTKPDYELCYGDEIIEAQFNLGGCWGSGGLIDCTDVLSYAQQKESKGITPIPISRGEEFTINIESHSKPESVFFYLNSTDKEMEDIKLIQETELGRTSSFTYSLDEVGLFILKLTGTWDKGSLGASFLIESI